MAKLNLVRRFKTVISDPFRKTLSGQLISSIGLLLFCFFLLAQLVDRRPLDSSGHESLVVDENVFEINNYGSNVNLVKINNFFWTQAISWINSHLKWSKKFVRGTNTTYKTTENHNFFQKVSNWNARLCFHSFAKVCSYYTCLY